MTKRLSDLDLQANSVTNVTLLRLLSTTAASTTSTDHALQIGADGAANLRFSPDTIKAVSAAGGNTVLQLNPGGGAVRIGGALQSQNTSPKVQAWDTDGAGDASNSEFTLRDSAGTTLGAINKSAGGNSINFWSYNDVRIRCDFGNGGTVDYLFTHENMNFNGKYIVGLLASKFVNKTVAQVPTDLPVGTLNGAIALIAGDPCVSNGSNWIKIEDGTIKA